mgnify:CR=1 FL=1
MKKNILFASLLALAAPLLLTSCSDDESEDKSRITTYAVLEMNGDDFMKLNVGETFNDPGCVATMGSEDVSSQIIVDSNVNTSKPGFYTVNYIVYNEDGFPASASRDVMVVDPNNFASAYLATTRYFTGAPINVVDNGNGTYTIDDVNGGYYFFYRYPGYEPTYDFHLEAVITLNDDNTITQVGSGSWYFSSKVTIVEGEYDPAAGTITWVASNGLTVVLSK